MSHEPAIQIREMTKRYRGQLAVDGLSLEVPTGSIFGLLGENGAGKTTTIQTLLGMVVPDAGSVTTLGLNPVKHGVDVRRRVGYVPEQPSLYDWMTVAEIGWFAAGFHASARGGIYGYEQRYQALARGFGLPADRRLKQLSKGMRAKASLALALASDTELLILDEPTSGLDVLVRRDFLESMVVEAGEGRTVLLSSHQIGEVERVASHVALLHQGKLILAEPLDDLKARVSLVTMTLGDYSTTLEPPPGLPIEIIDCEETPKHVRWLVRSDDADALRSLRMLPGLSDFDVATPSLEDIYIGYMRHRTRPKPEAVAFRRF